MGFFGERTHTHTQHAPTPSILCLSLSLSLAALPSSSLPPCHSPLEALVSDAPAQRSLPLGQELLLPGERRGGRGHHGRVHLLSSSVSSVIRRHHGQLAHRLRLYRYDGSLLWRMGVERGGGAFSCSSDRSPVWRSPSRASSEIAASLPPHTHTRARTPLLATTAHPLRPGR